MGKKYLLYIHDELFDGEPKKSQLINNLLERHYHDTVDGGKTQADVHAELDMQIGLKPPPVARKVPVVQSLADVIEEDEHDPYKNLVYDSAAGKVADTELGDYTDSDKAMVNELKKRGQVR